MTAQAYDVDALKAAIAELERMRTAAIGDNCPMLALTLQLACDEAEEELLRRTVKPRSPARRRLGANVIRFPRKKVGRRRRSAPFAKEDPSGAEVLSFADHAR